MEFLLALCCMNVCVEFKNLIIYVAVEDGVLYLAKKKKDGVLYIFGRMSFGVYLIFKRALIIMILNQCKSNVLGDI